jgi:acetyltransferase AlgX (SGNH hydrolase-like protein)
MNKLNLLISLLLLQLGMSNGVASQKNSFQKYCGDQSQKAPGIVVKGIDGWLFGSAELRHLSVGPFTGKAAASVSKCQKKDRQDPLPAIVDFNNQLKQLNIELIVIPVPPKAVIYPEKLAEQFASLKTEEVGSELFKFYTMLKAKGVNVLDLTSLFEQYKLAHPEDLLYCKTDTHWSGTACKIVAQELKKQLKTMPWYKNIKKQKFNSIEKTVVIAGDLWRALQDDKIAKDRLKLRYISKLNSDKQSPILLMGDSHTLIFHSGNDMLAEDAGLFEQLSFESGIVPDLLSVRGSGATTVRISLYRKARKQGYLSRKKLIIWCFTARDFTEASSGWRKIPVKRK